MARIKNYKGKKIGSTVTTYFMGTGTATENNYINILENKNYALVEDQNQNKVYFADSTNDSLSLVPEYDRKLRFEDSLLPNLRHGFANKLIYTSKPTLLARFNFQSTQADEELLGTRLSNHTFKYNADLVDSYNKSNFFVTQANNEQYTFIVLPSQKDGNNQSSNYNTAPGSRVIIAKGDDLSSIDTEYIELVVPEYHFNLLTVDMTNNIIYLLTSMDSYRNVVDSESANTYVTEALYALPFKTIADDNAFEFEPLKKIIDNRTYSTRYFYQGKHNSIFYMGQDSSGDLCFSVVEAKSSNTGTNVTATQLGLHFLKCDAAQLRSVTTYTDLNSSPFETLDCFEIKTFALDADPNTAGDYKEDQFNPLWSKGINFDAGAPDIFWYYLPLFSNTNNLKLLALEWDKGEAIWANAFTLYQDLTSTLSINGGAAGDTTAVMDYPGTHFTNTLNQGSAYEAGYQISISNTNKLHLTFNYVGKESYDDIYPLKTTKLDNTVSFSIDVNSPQTLTYENVSVIPSLNSMLIKDYTANTHNELVVLRPDSCAFYFYTAQNGWTKSHSETGTFSEFTLDYLERRWAIKAPLDVDYEEVANEGFMYYRIYQCELHLLSQVLPYTTSIEFVNTDITYTGADINNSLKINAYDSTGARIAVDVLLSIEGTNMVFSQNPDVVQTVITTSQAQDTIQTVIITGPGYANVSASFDV